MSKINIKSLIAGVVIGGVLVSGGTALASSTKSISAYYNDIKLKINGKVIETDAEPFILNGRTFVPARFVAEPLGATVKFNETDNAVEITSNAEITPAPTPVTTESAITTQSTTRIIEDGIKVYTINGVEYILPETWTTSMKKKQDSLKSKNNYTIEVSQNSSTATFYKRILKEYGYSQPEILIKDIPLLSNSGWKYVTYDYYKQNILPLVQY